MSITPTPNLEPLAPILGRWRSSGNVVDREGNVEARVAGTDVYELLPGGHWIAHDVDVLIGDEHTVVHEIIGGIHPDGGWQMNAFGADENPETMRLTQEGTALLLLHGDDVRSWFNTGAGDGLMTTRWERKIDGSWHLWMDMRFERI